MCGPKNARSHFERENGISILWISWCECETTSNQELGLGDLYVVELFVKLCKCF